MNALDRIRKFKYSKAEWEATPERFISFLTHSIRTKKEAFLCISKASIHAIDGGLLLEWKGKIKSTLELTDKTTYKEQLFILEMDKNDKNFWSKLWDYVQFNLESDEC